MRVSPRTLRLLRRWADRHRQRDPDFIIGGDYLLRWWTTPWRRWTGRRARRLALRLTGRRGPARRAQRLVLAAAKILVNPYVHEIWRSDDDRALHDHPWPNVSIVLWGEFTEVLPVDDPRPGHPQVRVTRRAGDVVFRRARQAHRLEIENPCAVTLFVCGPKVRPWGFWCEWGWRHWKEFVATDDEGKVGRGCE